MSEERPSSERHGERDSQLSAMFDGELSGAECELLARRLARDESLRGQWSRYSLIGAAVRAERGVRLDDRVARKVLSAIAQEASYGDLPAGEAAVARSAAADSATHSARVNAYERWLRFARPVVGASIAAGVAAVSIMWLRTQDGDPSLLASETAPVTESIVLEPEPVSTTLALNTSQPEPEPITNGEPERYSTPAPSSQASIAPPARFANYVVAHSEYSGPLARRMALLGIVGADAQADGVETPPAEDAARTGGVDGR
jgi:negative regulator of sigma E activity